MKSRGRQGLLPYFRIEIPEQRLAEQERSIIMLNLRLELSTVGAKAQSACLLGRVARLGKGTQTGGQKKGIGDKG